VAAIPFTLPIAGARSTAPEGRSTRAIRVALVQTAVSQEVREDPEAGARAMAAALDRLLPAVAPGAADLVVLPETAFLVALESPIGRPYLLLLQDHSRSLGAPLLVGAFGLGERADADAPVEVYNSVFLIDADGVVGRYDKRHLVPGVERTPLLPARLAAVLGDTASYGIGVTRALTAPTPAGAVTLGPLVCYESAFGGLAREHVRAGAEFLVNVTNDAWFGEGVLGAGARVQHEAHLVLRAIENRIPVVRSANGGVSMMVGPRGGVARVGIAGEEGVELVTVELEGVPGPIRWLEGSGP
jgi:apolipoprotein N-acyltransferase